MKSFLICLTLLSLFACQNFDQTPPDVLRIYMGAEPPTLNVMTAADASASSINQYIFDNLIERDLDTLEFKPKLATHWEISEDKKTYVFHLRRDVHWHDGHPFTADDVVYSFQLLKDPKLNAPYLKVYYQDMDRVTKIDDYTVEFHYSQVYFLGLSICGTMPLVPKHIVEQSSDFEASTFSRHPVGMGPYKFQEWKTGSKIVLVRNEDYWGPKPEIHRVEYRIISDPAVGLQILKKGELDYYNLSAIQWAKQTSGLRFNEMFHKFVYPSPGYSYIGWNNDHVIFKDARVRRAMTHMIDREKIIEKIYFGLGQTVIGTFFPYSKQYHTGIEPLAHDVREAKRLLEVAGWADHDGDGFLDKEGQVFEFTFLYPSGSKVRERLATVLKEDLYKIGIRMDVMKLEWAAFLDRIDKRQFDATALGWSSPFEQDPYQIWDISQADVKSSSNFIGFRHQQASDLLRQARVEFDEKKRNELYWRFQEIIHEAQPYTFLFSTPATVAVSKRFTNIKVHKAGLDILEWRVK